MESVGFFDGRDKSKSSDHQPVQPSPTTKPGSHRRFVLLVLPLSVVAVALIGLVSLHKPASHPSLPPSSQAPNSTVSLRSVCSVTRYPVSCFSSISSLGPLPPRTAPDTILGLSLRVAVAELRNLSSLPGTLTPKSNDPRGDAALRDCSTLFDDAASQLERSEASLAGSGLRNEKIIGDLNTWISGAMTSEETCLDGLEETGSTALDEIRAKAQKSKEYMSNTLSILVNIHSLRDKLKS